MGFKDVSFVFAVFAAWFVLSRWVLPALGVPTCGSGGCCPVGPPAASSSCDVEGTCPTGLSDTDESWQGVELVEPISADQEGQEDQEAEETKGVVQ